MRLVGLVVAVLEFELTLHPAGYKNKGARRGQVGVESDRDWTWSVAWTRTAPGSTHPVAVYGTVQRVHRDGKGEPFVFLADHTDLDGREFEVMLRSMHPTLMSRSPVGTHVLAVGSWGTFPDGRVPQLCLFAEAAWPIAYWHIDEDTGSATQPVSPPTLTARQRATERSA